MPCVLSQLNIVSRAVLDCVRAVNPRLYVTNSLNTNKPRIFVAQRPSLKAWEPSSAAFIRHVPDGGRNSPSIRNGKRLE